MVPAERRPPAAAAWPGGNTIGDIQSGGADGHAAARLACRPPPPDTLREPNRAAYAPRARRPRDASRVARPAALHPSLLTPPAPLRARRQAAADRLLRTDSASGVVLRLPRPESGLLRVPLSRACRDARGGARAPRRPPGSASPALSGLSQKVTHVFGSADTLAPDGTRARVWRRCRRLHVVHPGSDPRTETDACSATRATAPRGCWACGG